MSHYTGTIVQQNPAFAINPNGGPGDYPFTFSPPNSPEQGGTKLLTVHFTGVNLPAGSTLEVDLGYGKDVFDATFGSDFWTRPVNVYATGGGVPIILHAANGSAKASISEFGRGERHHGHQDPTAYSNCDPFLKDPAYTEPKYDPFWYGVDPPEWDNVHAIPTGDIRRDVAASVGMIVCRDGDFLSTCTVTLVGPDLVLTAGHCIIDLVEEPRGASIIFGYQTESNGNRLPNYKPTVAKVTELVARAYDGVNDYCLLRVAVPPGGLGIPVRQMRHDLPAVGEKVFGLHHPNGAVMKVSAPKAAAMATVTGISGSYVAVSDHFDVSGGSSGSPLFDMSGRVIGVLSNGNPQGRGGVTPSPLVYSSTAAMLAIVQQPPGPAVTKDVALVIDNSGSMGLPGDSGRPKMDEARDAASLFVQLVRANTGNKVGVVSFSTTSKVERGLTDVTPAYKTDLVGASPYNGGVIGAIAPDASTSIGAGLTAAETMLNVPGTTPKSILLMTDGLENTYPWISTAEPGLGSIAVQAIGYGTPGSLDGPKLSALAAAHSGQYVNADSMLNLEKFFAQAFGSIFESGFLQDPDYYLKANQVQGETMPFDVCGEEAVTVVLGWDNENADLALTVTTPSGQVVVPAGDVITDAGRTWAFTRIPLPYAGERDGTWQVSVHRPGRGDGEFAVAAGGPETKYFLSVIAAGGPQLRRIPQPVRYYTGDAVCPMLHLGYPDGSTPEDAAVKVEIAGPDRSAGTYLSEHKLDNPRVVGGDTVPSRQATLLSAEEAGDAPVGRTAKGVVQLGAKPIDTGYFEEGGIFGTTLPDLLDVEGDYTFHATATYGDGCTARRELLWSVHAEVGIDPNATKVEVTVTGPGRGKATLTPQDRFGNLVGPGAGGRFDVSAVPGASLDGSVQDNGDGSYTVPVTWDPGASFPGLVVSQPDRPPVTVAPPVSSTSAGCLPWALVLALLAAVIVLLVLLLT